MLHLIDHNFELHARRVPEQTRGMDIYTEPGLIYVDSGLSCDTFNILHIKFGTEVSPETLEKAIAYFKDRQLAYCIWVNQENLTGIVKKTLEACGLSLQNEEVGMILDLTDYKYLSSPGHQNVKTADTPELIRDYAKVVSSHWNPPDQNVIRFYEQTKPAFLDPQNGIKLFVYYHHNEPVSTLELFPTDQSICGIYSFATLEAFRGLGIGSALFTFALNQAKTTGYQQLILQATEDGVGIYKKYGFKAITTYYEYA